MSVSIIILIDTLIFFTKHTLYYETKKEKLQAHH